MRLYLSTLNPTDSVTGGFLPAAAALGWDVTILTDQPDRYPGYDVVAADVHDPRAVIDAVAAHHRPDVIFSNSDHLQAATALAAGYFGLPGKDWRACVTAKNKALTRRALAAVEPVRSVRLPPGGGVPQGLPYPVVIKPALGVASEDVVLVDGPDALAAAVAAIRERRPEEVLVAEEFLDGPVRTLETLGDGTAREVAGGFATTLGPLPRFVEERLDWRPPDPDHLAHLGAALDAAGVGFGVCHTEYAVTPDGPRVIEINYRLIGDNCDFLLADLLGVPLHQWILRVHAGEPVSSFDLGGLRAAYGSVVSLVAERSGTVTAAPPDLSPPDPSPAEPAGGVRLWHRALRRIGDHVEVTGTNRDYLGLLRAVGPDAAVVDAAVDTFRKEHPWVLA
ncbi:ATP-grasp domain-containing protein [Microbispora bryophytorum]|uniref:Carboxylate--amine ligase n=1 Tax=Microbispora bryophytorum TaxID=1460882 RepID=A0A8H9LB45_9ACTN|nr:siderophore biosynthesis protein [Microbispora bryophytorum]MBD3136772.1 siderophore biosynthesis protein [Microbispora bryophytorum]TQS06349.1 siderophore biosynthesis protein [Microbispora bryophytorum]GGO17259.1 carboxylate--amine ligase [Microbispora bryophytorum]